MAEPDFRGYPAPRWPTHGGRFLFSLVFKFLEVEARRYIVEMVVVRMVEVNTVEVDTIAVRKRVVRMTT